MTGINEIVSDSILIEREYTNSNNNDGNNLPLEKLGYKGKEGEFIGLSVSDGIKKSYGISHKEKILISELNIFSKHANIIDTIDELRCFTFNYLCFLLNRADGDKTVKRIISILVRRGILVKFAFVGKSKRTFTLFVYHTHLATREDILSTIKEYQIGDDARHRKDLQRKKDPPKTAEYVTAHNDEMKRRSKAKIPEKCCDYTSSNISGTGLIHHTCGKGTVRQIQGSMKI